MYHNSYLLKSYLCVNNVIHKLPQKVVPYSCSVVQWSSVVVYIKGSLNTHSEARWGRTTPTWSSRDCRQSCLSPSLSRLDRGSVWLELCNYRTVSHQDNTNKGFRDCLTLRLWMHWTSLVKLSRFGFTDTVRPTSNMQDDGLFFICTSIWFKQRNK